MTNCFSYDTLGNLIEQIEGLGDPKQRVTSYTYNLSGQKASTTKNDGIKLFYEYDALGRLYREFSSDQSFDAYWEYNLNNQPTRVTDKQSTTLRSYDLYGRLVQEKLGNGLELNYTYDLFDRLTSIQYPDGTQADYRYNPIALTEVSYKDQTTQYQYDAYGQLTSLQLANGDVIQYAYDELQRLTNAQAKLFSQTDLTYDLIGNLIGYNLNGERSTFHYDDYNQIAKEEGSFTHLYEHDSLNNRTKKDTQSFDYNALNQILSPDCDYDANGNLTRYKETLYRYDAQDRLLSVQTPDSTENYTYDPFHRRLTNGSVRYAYQDASEIAAFNKDQCLEKRVLGLGNGAETGAAVLIELDGALYTPYHDHRGNVCALAKEEITESYRYNAFGEETPSNSRNPWRFSSKRHDATGLIYFGYRYYIPELGRWLTPDPIGFNDGPNRYAYCVNDPMNTIDLYGLYGCFWGGDESDVWSFNGDDRSDYYGSAGSVCYNILAGSAHGCVDFGMNFMHGMETLGYHVGGERSWMFPALKECQNSRVNFVEDQMFALHSMTEPDDNYQFSRYYTEKALEVGTLVYGAYALAEVGMSVAGRMLRSSAAVMPEAMLTEIAATEMCATENAATLIRLENRVISPKIERTIAAIEDFLGGKGQVITNPRGDMVLMRGNKKIRFDFNYTHGEMPHFHLEQQVLNGKKWKDAGSEHRYYFTKDGL